MKMWLVGGTVVACAGFYLFGATRPAPAPFPEEDILINVTIGQPAPALAAAPVHVDRVVDVSNLDSLLDPPPIPTSEPRSETGPVITRVGYEEPAATKPAAGGVPPIPMSKNDD